MIYGGHFKFKIKYLTFPNCVYNIKKMKARFVRALLSHNNYNHNACC